MPIGVRRAALVAAAISGLFSATVSAGDPGWYVGGNAGGNFLDDAENVTKLPDTFDPATPPGCTIAIPNPDGSGTLICILPTPPGGGAFTPGAEQKFVTSYDTGTTFGISVGYGFESGFRPEFSFAYRENDFESVAYSTGFSTFDGTSTSNVSGTATSYSAMASLWYDFAAGSTVMPYLGAGIGATQVAWDNFRQPASSAPVDDGDVVMGWHAGAGIGFQVTDHLVLSLDYRFVGADDAELENPLNPQSPITTEYNGQSATVGFRYNLTEGTRSDADGDGVADRKDKCPNTPKGVQVGSDGCPLDSDGDGVPDYLDKCPGTPAGVQVNSQGCEVDSDGDGIPDSRDACPGTPKGVRVDGKGCPIDSDGDGVPDYLDKCPGTPKGVKVNELGCAASDVDADGVPDEMDKCPNTPPGIPVGPDGCPLDSDGDGIPDYLDECPHSPPGAKVLPNGCALKGDCRKPRPGEQVDENGCAVEQRFILRGVKFEFDSDRLLPESKEILNEVASTLQAYPDVAVEVEGHTDDIGTDAYNLGLSERRANAVKVYLSGRGVTEKRMTPVGYGESRPIMSNDNEAGREENRRVEFKIAED